LRKTKLPVPKILQVAEGRPLFRKRSAQGEEELTLQGTYRPIAKPTGALVLIRSIAQPSPLARNLSAGLYDLGDGVALI
jgi:3-hydroxyacyl-CoA dehydrogenase